MAHPPGRLIHRPYKPNAAPERTTRTDQASDAVWRAGAAVAPDRPAPFWDARASGGGEGGPARVAPVGRAGAATRPLTCRRGLRPRWPRLDRERPRCAAPLRPGRPRLSAARGTRPAERPVPPGGGPAAPDACDRRPSGARTWARAPGTQWNGRGTFGATAETEFDQNRRHRRDRRAAAAGFRPRRHQLAAPGRTSPRCLLRLRARQRVPLVVRARTRPFPGGDSAESARAALARRSTAPPGRPHDPITTGLGGPRRRPPGARRKRRPGGAERRECAHGRFEALRVLRDREGGAARTRGARRAGRDGVTRCEAALQVPHSAGAAHPLRDAHGSPRRVARPVLRARA